MALSTITVVCACVAFVHADQVSSEVGDEVVFLQSQIETASRSHADEAIGELSSEYSVMSSPKCVGDDARTANQAAAVDPLERLPAKTIAKEFSVATVDAAAEDPPGAVALRAALQIFIILIVLDGMRRWRLQEQDSACKQKRSDDSSSRLAEEAAAEAAWIKMVSAASTADASGFSEALQLNPRLSQTDAWGCTPLHFAAAGGSAPIATEMLRRGADVDARDAGDETPLHFAARAGHGEVCEVLLGAGADINAVSEQDMTPLVVAGHANQAQVCHLLADRGAGAAGLADEQLPPLVVSQFVRRIFAA